MEDFKRFKREFQKCVKAYRDTLPSVTRYASADGTREVRPEYPKAMLTARQAEKRTATIHLGRWVTGNGPKLIEMVNDIKAFIPFHDWCLQYGVTVGGIEHDSYGHTSLRLNY